MNMRTTLTIDKDNAVRLERVRKECGANWKDVVNNAIRLGLDALETPPPAKRKPFKTRVFDGGKPLFDSPQELKELIDSIQLEEDLRKLGTK